LAVVLHLFRSPHVGVDHSADTPLVTRPDETFRYSSHVIPGDESAGQVGTEALIVSSAGQTESAAIPLNASKNRCATPGERENLIARPRCLTAWCEFSARVLTYIDAGARPTASTPDAPQRNSPTFHRPVPIMLDPVFALAWAKNVAPPSRDGAT
jgi:hypothetical protein